MNKYHCPHCQQPIYDHDALNCLFCGESLQRDTGLMSRMRYIRPKVVIFFIVVITLLSFLILVLK